MEEAVQILQQCEELVKLKIRKDEDNSGSKPPGDTRRPCLTRGSQAGGTAGHSERLELMANFLDDVQLHLRRSPAESISLISLKV